MSTGALRPAPSRVLAAARQPRLDLRPQRQRQAASKLHNGASSAGVAHAENTEPQPSAGAPSPAPSGTTDEPSIPSSTTGTLLVKCPDQKGVVAGLAQLLYGFGCNIVSSDQFSDVQENMFYQRIEFDYSDLIVGPGNTGVLERGIAEVARKYTMQFRLSYRVKQKRLALLVSKLDHCLYDLLIRQESGELNAQIPAVISNHPDLAPVAEKFGVPFFHLPIAGHDPAAKAAQEAELERLLRELDIDLIVLARYMQIFSPEFSSTHWERTINVHHSFLPAFEGARPYHRAHDRGVKVIGATAHYATKDLDCGPIIEQHVARVTHRDGVADMVRKGRDLERLVLARAVRWHVDDRVIVHNNKTVVFED